MSKKTTKERRGTAYPTALIIAITTSGEIVVLAIKWFLLKEQKAHDELCKIKWDIVICTEQFVTFTL